MDKKATHVLIACWIAFFWSISLRTVFFILMPVIIIDLNLTTSQSGLILGAFFLGYACAVWVSGFLPWKRKTVVLSGVILSFFVTILLFWADNFWFILILAPLYSFGPGLYLPKGLALIGEISSEKNRGRNMSIHEMAASVGVVFAPLYVSKTLTLINWEYILLSLGIFKILIFMFFWGVPDNSNLKLNTANLEKKLRVNSNYCYFAFSAGTQFMLLMGLTSIIPIIFVNYWGIEATFAAAYLGIIKIVGIVGPAVAGVISDYWGRLRILVILFAVSAIALFIMALTEFSHMFTIAMFFLAFASSGITPVFYAALIEFYSAETRDKAVGTISSIGSLLGVAGSPALFGLILEHFFPSTVFYVAAFWVVLGLIVTKLALNIRSEKDEKGGCLF